MTISSKMNQRFFDKIQIGSVDLRFNETVLVELFVALPRRISFGHKYVPSLGSSDNFPIGHWFKRLATSRRQVYNSIGVKIAPPIAFFNADFVDFTIASEQPFW